jgi:hypothetical protein
MYNKREICGVGTGAPGTESALHQIRCIERAADYLSGICMPSTKLYQKKKPGQTTTEVELTKEQ